MTTPRPRRAVGPGVVEIAEQVRSGRVPARDVVSAALAAIERLNPELNAFVHVDHDGALARAAEIDRAVAAGADPGPLAGVPMGVKELHAVAGWPYSMGSRLYADRIADHTSTLVARAVSAGAVPVGVTASPEFGRASFTASPLHGVTRNPWNPELTPGGSSGGSAAAVAAGMVPMATGTDGAGSLRIPAAYCNLVGFKATYGVVPRGPHHRGVADNDHYGVLTRSVRDTARVLDCVTGLDPYDRASIPAPRLESALEGVDLRGLRVAFLPTLGDSPCDPEVAAVAEAAAQRFFAATGARRVDVDIPIDAGCAAAFRVLSAPDVYAAVTAADRGDVRDVEVDAPVRRYLDAAAALHVEELLAAHETRARLVSATAAAFERMDLLLTSTTQVPAFRAEGPMPTEIDGRSVDHWGALAVTYPFNLTGQPAVSVPAGWAGGAPSGLQIVGRRHADAMVLAAAALTCDFGEDACGRRADPRRRR